MKGRLFPIVVAAAVVLLSAPPAVADAGSAGGGASRQAAMGPVGEIYVVKAGAYGELFPDSALGGGLADPSNPALAIEVIRADRSTERLLVPGTETHDEEDSASVLFEDESQTLFVLWQTKSNLIHSRLNLIGLRDGTWSQPIEVSGNPFGWKSSPQLAVTRDSFSTEDPNGGLRAWQRTVAHLIWWEEGADGPQTLYSPVIFVDGTYIGWNPVYRLEDLSLGATGIGTGLGNAALAEAPRLEPGRLGHTVVIAFVDSSTGDVVTLSVELVPGEISHLADRARAQIVDLGRALYPGETSSLADRARAQIVDLGNRLGLHESFTGFLSSAVAERLIAAEPGEDLASLADRARAQIVDLGSRIGQGGLDRGSSFQKSRVLDLPTAAGVMQEITGADIGAAPSNMVRMIQVSSRPVPGTGPTLHTLYLSKSARDLVLAWQEGNALRYRESLGDDWSDVRTLRLDADLTLEQAHEVLARRAHERGKSE